MNSPENNRDFPRVQFRRGVAIENETEIMAGKIEDLTVHGICFQINRELEVGSKIYVDFLQSEEVENTQLEAEVIRSVSMGEAEEESYQVAARFTKMNDRFLMDILAMVNGPQKDR
ncbi:MAG: PilZ domain-containing protein [Nitrospinae bacterium]|nr:PilZ domain-containing protein [Nitrospinota bacterium]